MSLFFNSVGRNGSTPLFVIPFIFYIVGVIVFILFDKRIIKFEFNYKELLKLGLVILFGLIAFKYGVEPPPTGVRPECFVLLPYKFPFFAVPANISELPINDPMFFLELFLSIIYWYIIATLIVRGLEVFAKRISKH